MEGSFDVVDSKSHCVIIPAETGSHKTNNATTRHDTKTAFIFHPPKTVLV
jgi:hypothetical protein